MLFRLKDDQEGKRCKQKRKRIHRIIIYSQLGKYGIKGGEGDPNRKIICIIKTYVRLDFSLTKIVSRIYAIS